MCHHKYLNVLALQLAHALQGGFFTLPGKEESSDRETDEELDPVHSDPKTYDKTKHPN